MMLTSMFLPNTTTPKKTLIGLKQTGEIIASLFERYDALICIFSLGAVIRLIAPFVRNKKSDPAVLVIDDRAKFVISALSGHLGGANELARKVSSFFLIRSQLSLTAADVNETATCRPDRKTIWMAN